MSRWTYTGYSRVEVEKNIRGDYFFKLPKGGDLKKDFGKPCCRSLIKLLVVLNDSGVLI